MVQNPFEAGVPAYVEAGWDGTIPIKAETKLPVLRGVTGREGVQVTADQALAAHKSEFYRDKNLALRLPRGVVGVDVDDYETKSGGRVLIALEQSYGKLPPGPVSTARGFGVSGIRFFRVPENLEFESVFGDDIECIQFHHRFAVVWPSVHHTGETYQWYDADGNEIGPPRKEDLPELPTAWVEHFGHEPWEGYKNRVTFPGVEEFIDRFNRGDAPHLFAHAKSVFEDSAGSRHDSMLKALGRVTRDAVAGFYPAGPAIEELREMYEDAIGGDRRNDFDDLLETTCADAMNTDVAAARERVLGEEPEFRIVREGNPVLLVEGGDGDLVEYLPRKYGLAVANNLSRVEDFDDLMDTRVHILLKGDPAEDLSVYEAGQKAADLMLDYEVEEVKFFRLPGGKSLSEFLDKFDEDVKAERLAKRLDRSLADKPADRKPSGKSAGVKAKEKIQKILDESPTVTALDDGRYQIRDNGDSREFYNNLVSAVRDVMSADRLFYFGGKLSERRDDTMHIVDKDYVRNPMVDAVRPVRLDPKTGEEYEFEFSGVQCGILLSRAFEFDELQKLSQAPFIRPDGTICQENGYDVETKTYLSLSEEFHGFEIPHTPTAKEVRDAVALLDEAVHDFPFATPADRANAFAMYITPFIRNMAPTVPLAVVDGREPGVGKNLLAGIMALVVTGKNLETNTYPNEEEEMRKTITAIFRSGKEVVCFDEAHHLTGKYLAQVLTSETWTDRTLGSSESIGYPNQTTWISLGNQVKIGGDLGRRVYRINLAYDGEDPASRPLDHYLHPDVKEWTVKNRAELVKACLTLVRNWFSKGQPAPTNGINMGSFERWVSIVGGILESAGVEGFLDNIKEWTDESDSDKSYWRAHFEWLHDQFGDEEFTVAAVKMKLTQNNEDAPPGMQDTSMPNYTQKLGILYRSYRDRRVGGYSLRKASTGGGNKTKWTIYRYDVDESNQFSAASGGGPVDPFN